jgi:hypothetical protein
MNAVEEVTWGEIPVFRALMAATSPGDPRFAADHPVFGLFTGAGFEVLARTEDGVLVGGVERFTRRRPVVRLAHPALASFRDFDEPGCVKIGLEFRVERGTLMTETRVYATDARSRRLFGLYWLCIRGGSGLIRHVWLRAIRRRALLVARPLKATSDHQEHAPR